MVDLAHATAGRRRSVAEGPLARAPPHLECFTLITLEAVRETPEGAEVSGRAGEREVIAIALSSTPPFVSTLSDGPPWTLDDAPRKIPLAPGSTLPLVATPKYIGKPHELVVFRR